MPSDPIKLALTTDEATALGACLTFALDIVGEEQPSDTTIRRVLDKLKAATRSAS